MDVLFILLGIISMIINANKWFIIPTAVVYILFAVGVVCLFIRIRTIQKINKMSKKMTDRF